ncbi:unnamed protein product [Calicophoron daubneyi]|uniref:Aryl hydrocarbon receptor nuclear translocator n=1 Tax=Calicophoron daubneyi TaxID=300641 RepID=A0AAV2TJU1_CALDB
MVENLASSDFSRDSDVGSDRDNLELSGSQFSLSKRDGSGDQQDKERYARESHCEIERRRRNKMTAYINELCEMVPTCSSLARKPDKLTILRMAVSHMKSIRGTGNTGTDGSYKPSFLSDQELKHLVLEAADGFLFVCQCDTGRIIYVSDSVTAVLNQTQSEWYQHTLYELCHPDDAEKICEQLTGTTLPSQGASVIGLTDRPSICQPGNSSSSTPCKSSGLSESKLPSSHNSLSPSASIEFSTTRSSQQQAQHNSPGNFNGPVSPPAGPTRILDLKTGTVKKEGHQSHMRAGMGARRGFICRMRMGSAIPPTSSQLEMGSMHSSAVTARACFRHRQAFAPPSSAGQPSYALIHVTGFVKPITSVHSSSKSDMQVMNGQTGSQPYPLFDGLISEDGEFVIPGQDGSTTNLSDMDKPVDQQVPHCLVALGRLQVANRPDASDLSPRRSQEFVTRHSVDARVTFCDQRVQSVLGVSTDEVLGKLFLDLMPSAKDKSNFQEVFDRAWKFKGEVFSLVVHMRGNSLGDPVSVRCTLFSFANPYSEEVEYVVCTTTSMKSLQTSAAAVAACGMMVNHGSGSTVEPPTCFPHHHSLDYDSESLSAHPSFEFPFRHQLMNPTSALPHSTPYENESTRPSNDLSCSTYWRPTTVDESESFNPSFHSQPQNSLRLPSNHQNMSFAANQLSSPSAHSLPGTQGSSGGGSVKASQQPQETDACHVPNSGAREYMNSASCLDSDYPLAGASIQQSAYPTGQIESRTLRVGFSGEQSTVCQSQFYGSLFKHPSEPDASCHSSMSLLPDNDLVRAPDSGLTRPSAICYLPCAASAGEPGTDISSLSSSPVFRYPSANRGSSSQDVYQTNSEAASVTDARIPSANYSRSPVMDNRDPSMFHGWYPSDLTPCPPPATSVNMSSSASSESYRQSSTSVDSDPNELASLSLQYASHIPGNSQQPLPVIPTPTSMSADSNIQPNSVQVPNSTYFDYFHCDAVYPSPAEDYRRLTSVNATPSDA